MATKFWQQQLLSIASCLFILAYIPLNVLGAYGTENQSKFETSRVSYKPALSQQVTYKSSDIHRLVDLSPSATTPNSNQLVFNENQYNMRNVAQPAQQQHSTQVVLPSIYHSIIDRTTASTQLASPVQATTSTVGDLNTAAGHHHGHAHGKYYEYREVPKKKTWKFGYKRGNHKHTIERHEHGKAGKHPHFKTKVKWHDKKSKGKGIHLWDYNHHDKKHYHHG